MLMGNVKDKQNPFFLRKSYKVFRALLYYSLCLRKKLVWKFLCKTQKQVADGALNSVFLILRYSCACFLLAEAPGAPGIPLPIISYSKSKKEEENLVATANCHPRVWGTAVSVGWNPLLVLVRALPLWKRIQPNCFLASPNYSF